MEKRPSRIYLFFSLGFIFMLICAVGSFFYGLKVGTDRTEATFDAKTAATKQIKRVGTYPQQDLVSFYHTVLLPYREFQNTWFEDMDQLNAGDPTTDNASIVRALGKLADEQYKQANQSAINGTSPLLQDAQTNYLKSLKLFSTGTSKYISKANSIPGSLVVEQLAKDEYIKSAMNYTLRAQEQMYFAILKWSSTMNSEIPKQVVFQPKVSITEWKSYPIAVKNLLITNILLEKNMYQPYYPQDITTKIDQMIQNGQSGELNVQYIHQFVDLLLRTDAIKANEFKKNKNRYYKDELLPQLPFFYE
ncbi:hypothetical protein [Paenibacillus terrigena]|uniref:hypothetical protein n=1 Tax=Paenibacillus terrigena TaxID=369333 RepID=UPI0003754B0D|nr:hypothetical protein [Paenibacillus terrigena]